jgi:hypothetical protein
MSMNARARALWAPVLTLVILGAAGPAPAGPVAMVTDLEGRATTGGAQPLALLDEVEAGTAIVLEEASRLVLVFYASGIEYRFEGPATLDVAESAPNVTSGAAPETRMLLGKGEEATRISPAGKAQASVLMRGEAPETELILVSPSSKVLETRPRFSWEPVAGAERYRFELVDEDLDTVAQATALEPSYELPEELHLEPGAVYTWEVETRLPGAVRVSEWAAFSVASAEERSLVGALRPPPDAPFSERLVFAVWLQQNGFQDEARRRWHGLQEERRDLELPAWAAR